MEKQKRIKCRKCNSSLFKAVIIDDYVEIRCIKPNCDNIMIKLPVRLA